ELVDEELRLRIVRRVVAVVVEPGLADRDDLRMLEQALEPREIELRRCLVRMQAGDAVDTLVLLDDGERRGPRVRVGGDRDDSGDAGIACPLDRGGRVVDRVEVRVGVDHAGVRRANSSSTIPGSSLRKSGAGSRTARPRGRVLGPPRALQRGEWP